MGGATETIYIEGNGIRPSHIGIGFAESNVMHTLNRTEVHAVCYKKKQIPLEHHPHDSRLRMSDEDVCQTLNTRMGTGGNNVPLVFETYEGTAPTTEKQSEDVCISEIRGVQGVGTGECHEEPGLQRRYRHSNSGGGGSDDSHRLNAKFFRGSQKTGRTSEPGRIPKANYTKNRLIPHGTRHLGIPLHCRSGNGLQDG